MKLLSPTILSSILLIAVGIHYNAHASEPLDFATRIFSFHKKLADKGNRLSQYKLGTMYELGLGTSINIKEAKHWYTLSAQKGHASANDRLTYLQIKNDGYNADNHANWLDNIRKQAQNNDAESIFLLGQLYQQGIGVDRNPNQAILLFKKASTMGMVEADLQVETVERERASRKKKQ